MLDLGTQSGATSSMGTGINDSGKVTGYAPGLGGHAFVYSGNGLVDLCMPGPSSAGLGINNVGQVTGQVLNNATFDWHAFRYSGGALVDLGVLTGGSFSIGDGINNLGQVVGYGDTINPNEWHAFLYSGNGLVDLGTFPGGYVSIAAAINDSGQVTGYSDSGSNGPSAFLYSGNGLVDLGSLNGSTFTRGEGINNFGQVVGSAEYQDMTSYFHGFLYSEGSMYDLNSLILSGSDWTISDARDINESGQIAATGYKPNVGFRALRLDPVNVVPEPPLLVLFLTGFVLMFVRRLRWSPNVAVGPYIK